jgi:hypothetical protein
LVVEAKIELERCRVSSLPGGGTPSCMEEKKALDRAKLRARCTMTSRMMAGTDRCQAFSA